MGQRCEGCPHNKVVEIIATGHQWWGCRRPQGTDCPRVPLRRTSKRLGPVKAFIRWALMHDYIDNFSKNVNDEVERIYEAYMDSYRK